MKTDDEMKDNGRENEAVLSLFHPVIREWFVDTYGKPTDIQEKAWPKIADGDHVLITAPTGSGKTLTAFLWAIDSLLTGRWRTGTVRVLYISPLKALNTDVRRNLLTPLRALELRFREKNLSFPEIRVLTRSGDTPQSERQKMSRKPPEILITTPESLNLILSSKKTRFILSEVRAVILDEIHSIASGKRGTFLMTGIERTARMSGEFQRIAISATVRPLERIAKFVGGYTRSSSGESGSQDRHYIARPVAVVQSDSAKKTDLKVILPENGFSSPEEGSPWPVFIDDFKEIIRRNRSSLFFTNTRRNAEKITLLLNEREPEEIAYSHHGSLSKEIRRVVEERLKEGRLKAIVATSSLELGIDIGELDEVVLVGTPPTVSSALQRIGRAGHSVGMTSRGSIYPLHGRDLIDAAVMADSVEKKEIEEVRPVEAPLDILAQILVSMTGVEEWNLDELFDFLRTCSPYRNLSRRLFDLVIEMLSGRYADSRISELRPRISVDRIDNSIVAREGALSLVYLSGGTIPDRGYFTLRLKGSGAKIGELDEEFVWERHVGDTFPLGAQNWRIANIDHQNVEVVAWNGRGGIMPFWRAESRHRDFGYSGKIGSFLETWNDRLATDEFYRELTGRHRMNEAAARETLNFLLEQRESTRKDLPHRHHLLVEIHKELLDKTGTQQIILHTLWGGKVNYPLSLILQAAWEERFASELDLYSDNDAVVLVVPTELDTSMIVPFIKSLAADFSRVEELLRKKLETTGYFGARFRENAGRALLLPRSSLNRRMPLWITRLRAKKLLDAVMRYSDFPILLETWRDCLQDEFDISSLMNLLEELHRGEIAMSETETWIPSPFSRNLIWMQTNLLMYETDEPLKARTSALSGDILREAVFRSHLRPRINPELVAAFEEKLKRLAPGYAPSPGRETVEWVKERLLIPIDEWRVLIERIAADASTENPADADVSADVIVPAGTIVSAGTVFTVNDVRDMVSERVVFFTPPDADFPSAAAIENLPYILGVYSLNPETAALQSTAFSSLSEQAEQALKSVFQTIPPSPSGADALLTEWLRYSGPVTLSRLISVFGFQRETLEDILMPQAEDENLVVDLLTENAAEPEVCDPDNLERLLRLTRAKARPAFTALPAGFLQLFLADYHRLTRRGDSVEDLKAALEQLFGYPAEPELWESEFFPARLSPYYPAWLDSLFGSSALIWFGCGNRKTSFCFLEDYDLFTEKRDETEEPPDQAGLLPDTEGRYEFHEIQTRNGIPPGELNDRLWKGIWNGSLSNDSYETLRKGIDRKFDFSQKAPSETQEKSQLEAERPFSSRRMRAVRKNAGWTPLRTHSGNWFSILPETGETDAIDREELLKDRVRQLFTRYGILFRQLLENELPFFKWSTLFRTLRLMELAGEILSGSFFDGIPGPQFISHFAFHHLVQRFTGESRPAENAVYFMNAQDPVSLCGLRLENLPQSMPPRLASTHIVFHGPKLVLVSRKNGKDLEFSVPPDDSHLQEYLSVLEQLAGRKSNPLPALRVETVNGETVRNSPYADALVAFGFSRDYKAFHLRRRFV